MIYRGYDLRAVKISPDLIGMVDNVELPNFYTTPGAVYKAGARYVDEKIREADKKAGK